MPGKEDTKQISIQGGSTRGPTPYPFINHFGQKRDPIRTPFIDKWYPFHLLVYNAASLLTVVNALSFKYE